MKFQKFLAVALSSLLLWQTPLLPQANVIASAGITIPANSVPQTLNPIDSQEPFAPLELVNLITSPVDGERLPEQTNPVDGEQPPEAAGPVDGEQPPEAAGPVDGEQPPEAASPVDGEQPPEAASPVDGEQPAQAETEEPPVSEPQLPVRDAEEFFQWVFLEQDAYEMAIGDVFQLTAEAEYASEITWSSSEEGIASVAEDGTVTANGIGTAQITAIATAVTEEGTFVGTAVCEITVGNRIQLNHSALSLYPGQTETLAASLLAEEPVAWASSKPEVVTVNAQGRVSARKAGTAVITATTQSGAAASCRVKVNKPSLSLKSAATAYVKSMLTLKATAKPSGAIQWKSSNPKVAKVNAKGQVTPKKTGITTITATCNGVSKKCKVTVRNPSLKLKSKTAILFAGSTYRPDITAKPSSKLKWKSSNAKVATVNQEGEIVGKKAGTATLTASLLGKKATCQVKVVEDKHKFSRSAVTVMKGKGTTLKLLHLAANESVYFRFQEGSGALASYSYHGNVCELTGEETGTVILQAVYSASMEGQTVTGVAECKVRIIDSGIIQQQTSIAVHTSKQLKLKNVGKSGLSITHTAWESSNAKIASVGQDGKIKGKASGAARITATVTYSDGTAKAFHTSVKVSNPKLKSSGTVMTVGKSKRLKLTGTNAFSNVKWSINKAALASIGQDGTVVSGYNTGKATITVTVDGKKIKHKLTVTNPQLKSSYRSMAVGNTAQIRVKGVSSQKNVTYKSKNKAVATVSKDGLVRAKSYGNAEISVKADGITLAYKVSVAPQRALDACKSGHQIMYSSTYSQARRMENGFYDCSSLVFRAYGRDTGLLGGIPSYAPSAAAMAYYLERTGKGISQQGLDASQLLPGDLIFYGSASSPNGRYKNIYHVSMYYGDGYRLENPLRYYYPDSNIVLIARPVR